MKRDNRSVILERFNELTLVAIEKTDVRKYLIATGVSGMFKNKQALSEAIITSESCLIVFRPEVIDSMDMKAYIKRLDNFNRHDKVKVSEETITDVVNGEIKEGIKTFLLDVMTI